MYDNQIGRWHSKDNCSEKFHPLSPYTYTGNNPINFVELDGNIWVNITCYHKMADGTYQQSGNYRQWIETGEDLRGIDRSTIQVNVYSAYVFENGNDKENVFKYTSVEIDESTGLDGAEQFKENTSKFDYYAWKLGKAATFGLLDFEDAVENGRDQMTGEYRSDLGRITQAAGGILEFFTAGRSAALGKGRSALISKLEDFIAETAITESFSAFGLTGPQSTVFSFHIAKYMYLGNKEGAKTLTDALLKLQKLGFKGQSLVKELNQKYGIDLDAPLDKYGAVEKALKQYIPGVTLPETTRKN
jgi:hypothetical protein